MCSGAFLPLRPILACAVDARCPAQRLHLVGREQPPASAGQIAQLEGAERRAVERRDRMADRLEHALDLVLAPLADADFHHAAPLDALGMGGAVLARRIVGQVGTIVTSGKAEDVAGQKWLLPARVVIPAEGEITVTATAEVMGDIRAAAGEITKIATPTRGWQTVNNPAAATAGAPVEKDSELRGRQAISTAIPSQTPLEATKGAVARLSGVTRSAGYENDTNETDERGIPAHSIAVVAEGGDTAQIAEAIFAKKTPGCGTYGTTTVSVRDEYGEPSQIRFFRATDMPVYARVTLRALSGYLSSTGDTIRKNLAAYINTLGIGEKLYVSRLYTPINAVAAETFYVESIEIGTSPGVLAAENIAVAFNAVVSCTVEDIEVIAT